MRSARGLLIGLIGLMLIISCGKTQDASDENADYLKSRSGVSLLGSKIPDMQMDAYYRGEITKIRLSDYRKKWLILFFYPADFSFVCPTELREMSENYAGFAKTGAEVVSISTDSVYVHRAWADDNEDIKKITYPMASDRSGRLSRSMGVYDDDKGVSLRASFVVDPAGHIIAYEVHDESIGRSAAELLRKLQAAIAVRNSGGGFCPANWTPGEEMVVPK